MPREFWLQIWAYYVRGNVQYKKKIGKESLRQIIFPIFDVLLTVHLSMFILVINQLDAQNLFYDKFISYLYMFRALCAHRQEVKIVLYSIWYHHTCKWPSRAQSSLNLCTGRPPTGVMIPAAV